MSYPVALVTVLLLTIWLVFFSRMSRRARRTAAALVFASLALVAVTTRVKGVTGDLGADPRVAVGVTRAAADRASAVASAPGTRASRDAPPASAAESERPSPLRAAAPDPANPPVSKIAAGEFSQFLGSSRDGIIGGVRLADDWTIKPPRLVWRRPSGRDGLASRCRRPCRHAGAARRSRSMVVAYSPRRRQPEVVAWRRGALSSPRLREKARAPRPTISERPRLHARFDGLLNCLDLETGKAIWRRDIAADNQSPQPDWGQQQLAAPCRRSRCRQRRRISPAVRWSHIRQRDGTRRRGTRATTSPSYSSPVWRRSRGVRQIVVLNQSSVTGHDPATGRVLWNHEWPRQQPSVAIPVVLSKIACFSRRVMGSAAALLQISRRRGGRHRDASSWESPRLKAKFTNPVLHDGFVYGLDDGVLVCLDPATGERRWRSGRYGHGQTLLVGNRLLVTTEDGDVVLVEASPDAHRELARFTAFSQKQWNPPALAGRFLLVRTDTEAACYELP